MSARSTKRRGGWLARFICAGSLLAAGFHGTAFGQDAADDTLAARVHAALARASDLPADAISVAVNGGIVTLTGSVVCAECGGSRTPAGVATVQQSLGAVVRAVPGVERVEFDLQYQAPAGGG